MVPKQPLCFADCVAQHREWSAGLGANPPFPWGVDFLDRSLGPAVPGHLYVIGASTNVGKSMFAAQIALSGSEPRLYVSLEDGPAEIGRRVRGQPPAVLERARVAFPRPKLGVIVDCVRAHVDQHGIRLVLIDYLQLIGQDGGASAAWSRTDEVRSIVIELKHLGRELGFAPVLVSRLRRLEDRKARPTIFDLAESATVETSAEAVLLLWSTGRAQVQIELAKSKSTPVGATATFERGEHGWLREVSAAPEPTPEELF
jgi:DnaB-like helicase C terminal domain